MSAIATRRPAAEHMRHPRPPAGQVRLTRRGRLLLVAVLAAVLVAAFTLGRETSYADAAGAERPAYRTVTVAPGQTMWEVARQAAPEQDPRVIVQRIIDLNGLSGASLTAGQELAVPLGG